jgi:hypothetical protein
MMTFPVTLKNLFQPLSCFPRNSSLCFRPTTNFTQGPIQQKFSGQLIISKNITTTKMSKPYRISGKVNEHRFSLESFTNLHGDSRFVVLKWNEKTIKDNQDGIYGFFDNRRLCQDIYTDCLKKELYDEQEFCFKNKDVMKTLLKECFGVEIEK